MSNGDEVTRRSHITRIYKDDDPDSGQWVDIERLDELRFVSKRQFPWREKRWKFDWENFDPEGDNVTKKKIKQHKDDSDDDAIDVPVRDMIMVTEGSQQHYQAYKHFFVNNDSNETRETHSRRVYHHDIPDDALDDNGNPPTDPDAYIAAMSPDKEKDQWVEVEMLDKYWTNERESRAAHGYVIPGSSGNWQEKKWILNATSDNLLHDESGDDADFVPVNNPDAGPQVDPPWRLDPLQNIVNVQWAAGAVFVWGTLLDDNLYYARFNSKGADPDRKTINLPGHGGHGFTATGSSYQLVPVRDQTRPTFLVCGNGADIISFGGGTIPAFRTRIFYSNDGLDWETAYALDGTPTPEDPSSLQGAPLALVWDDAEGSFYYDQNVAGEDQMFSSKDGSHWAMVGSASPGGDPAYRTPFEFIHCKGNDCFDLLDQHVPDGVMVHGKNKKITLRPKNPPIVTYYLGIVSYAFSGEGETIGDPQVEIVKETQDGKETTIVSIPGLQKVFCVAGANGIYMAGGSPDAEGETGAVVLSTDDGQTWTLLHTYANAVTTMVAASATDIPQQT